MNTALEEQVNMPKQDEKAARARKAILVLGMHRSGTSALTRVLNLYGAALPRRMMAPNPNNEKGYWEPEVIVRIHDELLSAAGSRWDDVLDFPAAWFASEIAQTLAIRLLEVLREEYAVAKLFVVKDPRICRLLPLWLPLLDEFDVEPSCAIIVRNPLEVAASLEARDGFEQPKSMLLWLRHFLAAERCSRGMKRAFVNYDELLSDWRGVVHRLGTELEITWPGQSYYRGAEVDSFLSTRLRHHSIATNELVERTDISEWVKVAFEWAVRAARGMASEPAELDAVSEALQTAELSFAPLIAMSEVKASRLSVDINRLTTHLVERDGQIGSLNEAVAERDGQITSLDQAVAERDGQIASLDHAVAERDGQIASLDQAVAERDGQIASLNKAVAKLQSCEANLRRRMEYVHRQIDALKTSTSWQLTAPLRYLSLRCPRFRALVGRTGGRILKRFGTRSLRALRSFVPTVPEPVVSPASAGTKVAGRIEPVLVLPLDYPVGTIWPIPRLAVLLHAYYVDTIAEFQAYLCNIPFPFALFVSTDTQEKKRQIEQAFVGWRNGHVDVRVMANRGRDVAPKFVGFRDTYDAYRFVLHLHSKKSPHGSYLEPWRRFLLDCLVGSTGGVAGIFEAFERRPDLGIVAPRTFAPIRHFATWGVNLTTCSALAQRMGIAITPDSPCDFPAGSMFWARSAALRPLLDLALTFDDFPEELGQQDGTLAHAIERLSFYACELAGYKWTHAGTAEGIAPPEHLVRVSRPNEFEKLWLQDGPVLLPAGTPLVGAADKLATDSAKSELKVLFRRRCSEELTKFLDSDTRIVLPTSRDPEVSIILVLYNEAELTFETLRSLVQAIDVPAEVIIVDNASKDRTRDLCRRIDGAEIIRNFENLHFLRGVNQAAAKTRGQSLLLLNNDTRVARGSIHIAHDILCEEPDVGAVGGKIVLLDGTLQEAGSIVWQDGTCLGYGRGRDPGEAEFQFRRDVDYCSGAFLLVRRELFERLGWFDEKYAPAYYEETDLCMRIRDAGYRIVYEPRIEISHFEFGSSSSSEAALALQKRNHAIFKEQHRNQLVSRHLPARTRPLEARMNGDRAGRILVIDERVPYPALGAGYPRANELLRAIHTGGWFVTFYPLIFPGIAWEEAYRLLPRDVEIMADHGFYGLERFLRERIGYYYAVLVSRPHNMKIFRKVIQAVPDFLGGTKLIYDAEAIFATREAIRLALEGTPLDDARKKQSVAREIALSEGAAAVLAVSEHEAQLFRSESQVPVHVIGHGVMAKPTAIPFEARSDILFVGALDDEPSPNVDSLVWFVREVMPKLDRSLGTKYKLKIIGRKGSRTVQALSRPRVELLGQAEDLGAHYASARLFIAPTRYAAGIPRKVHDAAAAGLPVVATCLIAEQLGWRDSVELLAADRPGDFAAACHRVYTEPTLWRTLRDNALARIKTEADPAEFARLVGAIITEVVGSCKREGGSVGCEEAVASIRTLPADKAPDAPAPSYAAKSDDRKNRRVNEVWSADQEERAQTQGWYWMAHPLVAQRVNKKISGDPHVDGYRHLCRLLEARGWAFPVKCVVSLGCGFGALERQLAAHGFAERIIGYDLAEGAIEGARQRAREQMLTQLEYYVMDLDQAQLPGGSVDIVFGHHSVHHIEDLEGLCARVRRALKPGGIFHLNEFVGPTRFQWTDAQLAHINDFVFSLPKRYRLLPSGAERGPIQRPTIEAMIAFDPSESVRSAEIVDVVRNNFDIIEQRDIGGALLHIGLSDIAQNFKTDNPDDMHHLERFFALEDRLMAQGVIGTDFTVITALSRRRMRGRKGTASFVKQAKVSNMPQ